MSLGKINKKKLSRNFRNTRAPLRVLPTATRQHSENSRSIRKTHPKQHNHKIPLTIRPFKQIKLTMNAFRWIFVLIIIYIAAGTVTVTIQNGTESLKNILIYSIMGFFTFFMGYLGWILARDFFEVVSGKKNHHNDLDI